MSIIDKTVYVDGSICENIYKRKAGEEEMSLEAMKLVSGAEQEARRRRETALSESKQKLAGAQEAGRARLEETQRAAREEAAGLLREKDVEVDKATAVTRAQSFKTCAALRAEAEGRLPKAVEFIVERIVKT